MKTAKFFLIISLFLSCNKEAHEPYMQSNNSHVLKEKQAPPPTCLEEIKVSIQYLNEQFEHCLRSTGMALNNHTVYIGMNIDPVLLDTIILESNIAKSQWSELNVIYLPQIGSSPNILEAGKVLSRNSDCSAADLTAYLRSLRIIYQELDMCLRSSR
jgi:hypothetical protein